MCLYLSFIRCNDISGIGFCNFIWWIIPCINKVINSIQFNNGMSTGLFLEWNETLNWESWACITVSADTVEMIVYVLPCEFMFIGRLSCSWKVGGYFIWFDVNFLRNFATSKIGRSDFLFSLAIFRLPWQIVAEISFNCCANAAKYWSKVRR